MRLPPLSTYALPRARGLRRVAAINFSAGGCRAGEHHRSISANEGSLRNLIELNDPPIGEFGLSKDWELPAGETDMTLVYGYHVMSGNNSESPFGTLSLVNLGRTLHGAVPFDIEGVFWSHRSELCTFDVMLAEFGLQIPALDRLAAIVRGADTARLDLVPEAAGLLAASLGLSRMFTDDLEQLAGMLFYDAFYRWARDASEETHNWPMNKPKA